MANRKLYRSRRNKIVAGVSGGLGEYLEVDPIIFRILFIFLTFAGGAGAVIYLLLMLIIPMEPYGYSIPGSGGQKFDGQATTADDRDATTAENGSSENDINNVADVIKDQSKGKLVGLSFGLVLILFGLYVLFSKIWHINWFHYMFPIILILSGLIILVSSLKFKNKGNA